jgi:hypothetical protein
VVQRWRLPNDNMRYDPEREQRDNEFRKKAMEHLEAALALTDETKDATANFIISQAIDALRADLWSHLHRNP